MQVKDYNLNCSQCGKKVGVLSLIGGTMNVMSFQICCMECLPKRLRELRKQNYNPAEIKSVGEWMDS